MFVGMEPTDAVGNHVRRPEGLATRVKQDLGYTPDGAIYSSRLEKF